MKHLLKHQTLDLATDVLVVGGSAGGIATFLHVDEMKSMMPRTIKRFKAAPFSGVFLDHDNVEGIQVYGLRIKKLFELHNSSISCNKKCLASKPANEKYKCYLAKYNMEYIETPIMILNSAYDRDATSCIVGGEPLLRPSSSGTGNCSAVPGWKTCEQDPNKCTPEQLRVEGDELNEFMSTPVEDEIKCIQVNY